MKQLFIIGMTGPTGSGKSTVAKIFAENRIPALSADEIARTITAPGTAAFREIAAAFGDEVIAPDGSLNRARLAEIVYADQDKNRLLCDITHPLITIELRKIIRGLIQQGKHTVLLDAPLLFDSNVHKMCDFCFAVLANRDSRKARIMERDDLSEEHAENRLSAQRTDEYYLSRSQAAIINNGDPDELQRQTLELIQSINLLRKSEKMN